LKKNRPSLLENKEPLTERELQIMELIALGKGVNEIAAELCISNKTVSTHKTDSKRGKWQKTSLAGVGSPS
jgi:DNA-binding NarL/FixJ family response regulator